MRVLTWISRFRSNNSEKNREQPVPVDTPDPMIFSLKVKVAELHKMLIRERYKPIIPKDYDRIMAKMQKTEASNGFKLTPNQRSYLLNTVLLALNEEITR